MTTTTKFQGVHDPHAQMTVRARAQAIGAVLAGTKNPNMPTRTADALAAIELVKELRTRKLDLDAIAATLATCGPKRLPAEIETAIDQVARQANLTVTLGALTEARLVGALQAALDHDHAEVARRLADAFNGAIADLATASARLPGADPLARHETVLQAGAGAEWTIANAAIATIRAAGQAFHTGDLHLRLGNADPKLAVLVPIVDTVDAEQETVMMMTGTTQNTAEELAPVEAVRAYARAVADHGPDVALVRVARGDWSPSVRLALAADPAEMIARCRRLHIAHTQRVREGGKVRVMR